MAGEVGGFVAAAGEKVGAAAAAVMDAVKSVDLGPAAGKLKVVQTGAGELVSSGRIALTPGCQIGYMDILAVINWCSDCKIT
jgi:hypothetical protein